MAELGHQVNGQFTTLSTMLFGRFANQAIQSLRTLATRLSGQPNFIARTTYPSTTSPRATLVGLGGNRRWLRVPSQHP